MSKCVLALHYGSVCCPISRSQFDLLEFALCGSLMKIFNTRSKDIVHYCMKIFKPHIMLQQSVNVSLFMNLLCKIYQEIVEKKLRGYSSDCV